MGLSYGRLGYFKIGHIFYLWASKKGKKDIQ